MAVSGQFEWLADCASNTWSQFGEDGVLDAVFSFIGTANRWCLECGASDGLFMSNSRQFVENGWNAILVEAEDQAFSRLVQNCEGYGERVRCVNATVNDNTRLEDILDHCGAPVDIDLVVIDVDGQDYYLFNSLLRYRPRVVVIEFDHKADEDFIPCLGADGQAGLRAMRKLATARLYTEVHRTMTNLILVRHPNEKLLDGPRKKFLRAEGK